MPMENGAGSGGGGGDQNNNGDTNLPKRLMERRGSSVRFTVSDIEAGSNVYDNDDTISSQNSAGRKIATLGRRSSLSPSFNSENSSITATKTPRKRVVSKYDSLNYNPVESKVFLQQKSYVTPQRMKRTAITRWFVNFLIGACVAVIAVIVALLITYISKLKFMALYSLLQDCEGVGCLVLPLVVWMAINMALVLIGSYLVTCHAPHAAGSGIPQIKCYLNGIKLPGLLSMKTLVAKAGGVVLSVCGGLACGKEGPMIHSGSICASCIANGNYNLCGKKCAPSCCDSLRSDEERRDFVAAGAASGVSAAFASPVGGVLFSLEEGASFLKQMLTWRMLFSSMTASLLLNLMMSAIKGHPNDMSSPGLVSFGYIGDISFKTYEIPFFMGMAVIGGLLGAAFNELNYHITLLRRRYVTKSWQKIAEAVLVAACSAIILMVLIYAVPDCQPIRGFETHAAAHVNDSLGHVSHSSGEHDSDDAIELHKRDVTSHEEMTSLNDTGIHGSSDGGHHDPYGEHGSHGYVFQGFCPYGEHNRMADILFKTPEGGLHAMLHAPHDEWNFVPLIVLLIVYHLLATWTYGLMVSSGVFIPSLLIGAIWGRIVGMALMSLIPDMGTGIAKYALVGAACQLGGTVRMTISLTVIVIECTGDITFGIPIMLSLIIAKWVGDFFNPGIYDLHIEIMGIPLLPWEPSEMSYLVSAREVMSAPVIVLRTTESLATVMDIYKSGGHNGYPVVDDYDPDSNDKTLIGTYGRVKGFILKEQLAEIIKDRSVEFEGKEATIDLTKHMDLAPYCIQEDFSLPRIFRLFRGLGLRHLTVVNDKNRVTGIITRLNLAKFREEFGHGKFKLEELEFTH